MKIFKRCILMVFLSLAITACNKSDDDAGDGSSGGLGSFTATIDGDSFSGSVAASATETNANGTTIITMLASDANGRAINIIINPFDGVGTYTFSSESVFTTASYIETDVDNPTDTQIWVAPYADSGIVGELNISEKTDSSIEGTFNFEAKLQNGASIKSVTNGEFNLEL